MQGGPLPNRSPHAGEQSTQESALHTATHNALIAEEHTVLLQEIPLHFHKRANCTSTGEYFSRRAIVHAQESLYLHTYLQNGEHLYAGEQSALASDRRQERTSPRRPLDEGTNPALRRFMALLL
jgi:hypothetical protein